MMMLYANGNISYIPNTVGIYVQCIFYVSLIQLTKTSTAINSNKMHLLSAVVTQARQQKCSCFREYSRHCNVSDALSFSVQQVVNRCCHFYRCLIAQNSYLDLKDVLRQRCCSGISLQTQVLHQKTMRLLKTMITKNALF